MMCLIAPEHFAFSGAISLKAILLSLGESLQPASPQVADLLMDQRRHGLGWVGVLYAEQSLENSLHCMAPQVI